MTEWQPVNMQFEAGSHLPPEFELISELGRGSYGIVYKARHRTLDQLVAIKFFPAEQNVGASDAATRFRKEVKAIGLLSHPHIVKVLQAGVSGKGVPYIVYEFVEGESLESYLAKAGSSGVLAKELIETIFLQICDALSYAHEQGVVHRDLKPANIMIYGQESKASLQVKLLDFGIAAIQQENSLGAIEDKTKTGVVKGSPAYMSPEQCKGKSVDERSDIYSLATMLFECLTGRLPFEGETVYELLYNKLNSPPRLPAPELNSELNALLSRALSEDNRKRYADAADFALALKAGLRKWTLRQPFKSSDRRLYLVLSISFVLLLFGIIGGTTQVFKVKDKISVPDPRPAKSHKPRPASAEGELRQILQRHEERSGCQVKAQADENHQETIASLLALLPRLHGKTALEFVALDQAADCQFRLEKWQDARNTLLRLAELLKKHKPGIQKVAVSSRLALMSWKLRDTTAAEKFAKEALRFSDEMNRTEPNLTLPEYYWLAPRSSMLSLCYEILGNCAQANGEAARALEYYEVSELNLAVRWKENDLDRPCLAMAELLWKLDRHREAVQHLIKQVESIYARPVVITGDGLPARGLRQLVEYDDAYSDFLTCKEFAHWLGDKEAYDESIYILENLPKFIRKQGLDKAKWYKGVDKEIEEALLTMKTRRAAKKG